MYLDVVRPPLLRSIRNATSPSYIAPSHCLALSADLAPFYDSCLACSTPHQMVPMPRPLSLDSGSTKKTCVSIRKRQV